MATSNKASGQSRVMMMKKRKMETSIQDVVS